MSSFPIDSYGDYSVQQNENLQPILVDDLLRNYPMKFVWNRPSGYRGFVFSFASIFCCCFFFFFAAKRKGLSNSVSGQYKEHSREVGLVFQALGTNWGGFGKMELYKANCWRRITDEGRLTQAAMIRGGVLRHSHVISETCRKNHRLRFFFPNIFLNQEYIYMKISSGYPGQGFYYNTNKIIKTDEFFTYTKQLTLFPFHGDV